VANVLSCLGWARQCNDVVGEFGPACSQLRHHQKGGGASSCTPLDIWLPFCNNEACQPTYLVTIWLTDRAAVLSQ
jgi:hypothetical protein